MEQDIESILFTEDQIRSGTDRVAREITQAFEGTDFTVVSILKGSCIFASDLIRRIPIPLELAFCAASSYRDGTESGKLSVNFQPDHRFPFAHEKASGVCKCQSLTCW